MKHEVDIPENIQSQIDEIKDVGKATVKIRRAEIALKAIEKGFDEGLLDKDGLKDGLVTVCEMIGVHLDQFMTKE